MVAPVFISTNSVGGFPFLHTLSSIYCLVDSLIGEGNSTPLQYSCLENLMDGGAWWAACSPWGLEKSDTTERLHFHFSLSCIGEGNGNPFQCSCLDDPRDGGAWRAAVYGVAQSRTRLKRLSSSSLFDDGHSDQCDVVIWSRLDCSSLINVHVPLGHLYVFFGEMSILGSSTCLLMG